MILFYWFNVLITATLGGSVYATGDWREPLSIEDFGHQVEARWVIAGNNNLSSVYVWPLADAGYHFVGFRDSFGYEVKLAPSTITSPVEWGNPLRLWVTTNSAQTDDGIVSGADYYPVFPYPLTAVFEPDVLTEVSSEALRNDTVTPGYDLSGRVITTSRGQIVVRGGRKKITTDVSDVSIP